MKKKIKHHGFAHFVLFIVLFLLGVWAFGGWAAGPVTNGLLAGADAFSTVSTGASGNIAGANAAAGNTLIFLLGFIANLVVYYIAAAIVIFVFNIFFGGKKEQAKG